MRALVDDYGLRDRVVLESPTHRAAAVVRRAMSLLMTSVFEGVPVIVYEALAMELPIVAPALPGNPRADGRGRREWSSSAIGRETMPMLWSRCSASRCAAGSEREGRGISWSRFSVQEMARTPSSTRRLLAGDAPRPSLRPASPLGMPELDVPGAPAGARPASR